MPSSAHLPTPALTTALLPVDSPATRLPLHHGEAARQLEAAALALHPPHTLMREAGLAVARLALALAPGARQIWVACGPGNNGGDGLVAARWLHGWGKTVEVSLLANPEHLPPDAAAALAAARQAGVPIQTRSAPQTPPDLAIDALLGLGQRRPPSDALALAVQALHAARQHGCHVLAVDLPTGLDADSGQPLGEPCVQADTTLALLSLKPGLYTGQGRDWAGTLWWAPLLAPSHPAWQATHPTAGLLGTAEARPLLASRRHGQHKGSFGDVWVLGGASGMTGAALLAGRAALHAGAGRVFLAPPDQAGRIPFDPAQPELMHREAQDAQAAGALEAATVVCGCGAGATVASALPAVLLRSARLALDADALNALAAEPALQDALRERSRRGQATVITPHPLEAARLLGSRTAEVQAERCEAARALAQQLQCVVVLKGSGSIVARPGTPGASKTEPRLWINPTGNARLATPGSGDVLAGWLGGLWSAQGSVAAGLAAVEQARRSACASVWLHGQAASAEPGASRLPLPAHELIGAMCRVAQGL